MRCFSYRILGYLSSVMAISDAGTHHNSQLSTFKRVSPKYSPMFRYPVPIPPEIKPITLAKSVHHTSAAPNIRLTDVISNFEARDINSSIVFFQLNVSSFQTQVYPGLGKAHLVGYNGMSPGPTFKIQRGQQSVVRVVNGNDRPTVLHLHGSYSRAVWDGWAEDLIQTGEYKDYYFPNSNTARTLWYHDHAVMNTSVNLYAGLAGFYIIADAELESKLGLPQDEYDVPLAISAKQYVSSGDLSQVANEMDSVYGDVIEVNGQPWPFMTVEPRKYRFRMLNMALSRTFILGMTIDNDGTNIPLQVVASDSGFMTSSVTTSELVIAMAERWEFVIDFSQHQNRNLTMTNRRKVFDVIDYAETDSVMQFRVQSLISSDANNGPVPTSLVALPIPSSGNTVDRKFSFDRQHNTWLINGVAFDDIKNRILANPQRGATEIWQLENHNGHWSHPIHIHMVDFHIISRSGGRNILEPYEKVALKDVVVLGPKEQVMIAVTFAPFAGLYMFHCHNAIHEDHAMMDAFNVTEVQGLGYNISDLQFTNPLDDKWRAKLYTNEAAQTVLQDTLPMFAATNAYVEAPVTGSQVTDKESTSSSMSLKWSQLLLAGLGCCATFIQQLME